MSTRSTISDTIAGRYQVIQRIGSGGMGEVYKARDQVLGRTVALKILPHDIAQRPGAVDRFRTEAQAAARINHRNVVQVHDWGETDDTYFMVMEYVRGRNLREILATRGPLAARQACEIVMQVLDGLEAAHASGLVHRDIKPENVLVSSDGTVKVTDFGIARFAEGSPSTDGALGTVAYVAPEHARGERVDSKSDVYSVGCLFYELLTGSMPFEGEPARVLYQHLNEPMPLAAKMATEVPPALDVILSRATQKSPEARIDAAHMRLAIADVMQTLPVSAPLRELTYELTSEVSIQMIDTAPVGPVKKGRRPVRWMVAGLLLVALASLGYFYHPVKVPAVTGGDETKAIAAMRSAGLGFHVSHRFLDDPAGTVVSTNPSNGHWAMPWQSVAIVASRGPRLTDVPSLIGQRVDDAKAMITDARLVVGDVKEVHDKAPGGQVIDQEPKPGRVKVGQPVNLTVSSGPEYVLVPSVTGKQFADAQKALAEVGLSAERIDEFNDAPVGQVISQETAQGQRVEKGSTLRVHVSKGTAPFAMPDVKGKTCKDAQNQLQSLGLVVTLRMKASKTCGTNIVFDQDPFAGSTVKKGDEVILYTA
ncbi:MAG: PASTA domain-containing protein [Actinomycetota bacterium]|nr:PASTA domain-containing protein [Actinomycetota bacterium]